MKRYARMVVGAGLLLTLATAALSAENPRCHTWTARLVSAEGRVEVQYPESTEWRAIRLGETFCLGDRLRVLRESRAALELTNETILRLDEKTTLLLPEPATENDFWLDLFEGAIHLISRIQRGLEIRTPFVNAGLEGTEFVVRVLEDETVVSVIEGRVAVSNPFGRLSLTPGQTASATRDNPPVLRLDIRPEDTVQWALYYPWVVDPKQPGVDRSVAEAQQQLRVGRVDEARKHVDLALRRDPTDAGALALAAIIAVAQNESDRAIELAKRAVAAAPRDTSALLALSYAKQARFDLDGARAAVEVALEADPADALAWARLAELEASLGNTNAAVDAARRAVDLAPELSRTQSVLGFVAVTRLRLDEASDAFRKAIELDTTDPLPRLGLALVRIRRGDLEEGRRDLEIAASLDPANALVRSYLGKAYFDENRFEEAEAQFQLAKQLDPLDPTPWLYDSLRRLTANDPIGALRDLEQSIELNDNRAVTRSRLLLDEDRSARTADQAQVFRELGFERLIPGITARSLSEDPGASGIHRLQANAARPREQSARVSELLQWQLNAPLTTNLLQIQQSEANLKITSAADLVRLSGFEWSQLFSADGPFVRLNAVAGSKELFSNDLTLGYQTGPVVFSLGQFHYGFDGYAENNDQTRNIYGASMQWQALAGTVMFAEYRTDDREFGDLSLGFDDLDIASDIRTSIDAERWRLGLRHDVGPGTALLATVAGFDNSEHQKDVFTGATVPIRVESKTDDNGWLAELQMIQKWTAGILVTGAGHYDADSSLSNRLISEVEIPGLGRATLFDETTTDDTDTRHANAYAYWSATAVAGLDYTLGVSYDDYRGPELDRNQFSPKLGLMWHPAENLALRAVAARTFKRTLVAEQTVEPTQVAGFTQIFDDLNGTDARLYGAALDARLGGDVYIGGELRYRDLVVPFTAEEGDDRRTDWKERTAVLYGYWTPTDRLALRAELFGENLTYDDSLPRPDKPWSTLSLKTLQIPLSAAYSSPRGYTARATARWVDQDAELIDTTTPGQPRRSESDSFLVADLEFDYRLPKRHGRIAVGVRNLFDQHFGFQEPDLNQPSLARERIVYLRLNLSL